MTTRKTPGSFDPSRRRMLAGLAASTTAAASLGVHADSGMLVPSAPDVVPMAVPEGLPSPNDTQIDHVVVVMLENRSFDHYFGWLPGANGRQAGRTFVDVEGESHQSHDLAPDFQNCASADPSHSYAGGRKHLNGGRMDGFLKTAPAGDTFPAGYYTKASLPFFGPASDEWTVCDHYFSGILSSTYPNRFYMHAGQTDRLSNTSTISALPTIWDRLKDKGLRGEYYYGDIPFLALWGTRYLPIALPYATFAAKAALGLLADYTFIDPRFLGAGQGVSNDDHPLADIRNGQVLLNQIYNALRIGPKWSRTLMIVTYDEWGGFADHVAPALAPVSEAERTVVGNDGRLGFRVPCVLIGPRARRGFVAHGAFDPNAILNFVAWRFGLDGLGVRAATSGNIATALDFKHAPRADAPVFDVPLLGGFGQECDLAGLLPDGRALSSVDAVARSRAEHILELQMLRTLARRNGFPV